MANTPNDVIIKVTADTTSAMRALDEAIRKAERLEKTFEKTNARFMRGPASMGGGSGSSAPIKLDFSAISSTLERIANNTLQTANILNQLLLKMAAPGLSGGGGVSSAAASGAVVSGGRITPTPLNLSGTSAAQRARLIAQQERIRQDALRHEQRMTELQAKQDNAMITLGARQAAAAKRKIEAKEAADERQKIKEQKLSTIQDYQYKQEQARAVRNEPARYEAHQKRLEKVERDTLAEKMRGYRAVRKANTAAERMIAASEMELGVSSRLSGGGLMTNAGGQVLLTRGGRPLTQNTVASAQRTMQEKDASSRVALARRDSGHEPIVENVFRRALLFGAISAGIFKAIDAANQFFDTMVRMDKQLADLRKTLGGSDADFEKLMTSATNIARRYKASTQDVLDAMELFSGQFKRSEDLEALSESAILFSNLSGQDLKTSAETIVSTIQQYNMAVSDSAKITDAWANIAANSAVSIKDLGDAMGAAGNAAVSSGVSFDKFNALVATVATATGKSGREIGNALKRIFERSTSDENAKKLSQMGIYVQKANGEFRNFENILQELNTGIGGNASKSWDKLTDSQKKQIAVLFAGARQYDAFLAIMNNYNQVIRLAQVSTDSLGAAIKQNDRITETFVKRTQAFSTEYDKLARVIGTKTLPVLGKLVDVMTLLLRLFNDAPSSVQKLGLSLAGIAGGSFALSGLLKFVGTEKGPFGGISARRDFLGRASSRFIGPTIFNPSANGGVSVIGGIGRAVAGSSIGSRIPFAGAALGSSGMSSALAAFGVGLASIVVVIASLAAVGALLYKVHDTLRYKGEDLVRAQQDNIDKARQLSEAQANIGVSIKSFSSQRELIEKDKTISNEEREKRLRQLDISSTGVLKDLNKTNPALLRDSQIYFDRFGNAINVTADKLMLLAKVVDDNSKAIANNSFAKSAEISNLSTQEIEKLLGGNNNIGLKNGKIFARLGEGPSSLAGTGVDAGALKKLSDKIKSSGIDINRAGENPFVNTLFNDVGLGETTDSQRKNILSLLSRTSSIQGASQSAFSPELLSLLQEGKKKEAEKLLNDINSIITSSSLPNSVKDLLKVNMPVLASGLTQDKGVPFSKGEKSRIKPQSLEVTRIDFELQKSLVTNARNFELFGGEVRFVENAIQAYRAALSDLANETNKAAGPKEEMAMLAISGEIDKHQTEIARINKEEILPIEKERKILAEQLKIASLQEKQAIQEVNSEREKGIRTLRVLYDELQSIQMIQESIREPLKGALNGILPAMRETGVSLGQTTETGQTGRGTLQAKRIFAEMQLARQMEVQARGNYANTAKGRNELKHIREEIKGIDQEMSEVVSKTNIWQGLLKNIGDTFINKITGKLTDSLIEGFGSIAGDQGSGFSLFGQLNPKNDALKDNTTAIMDLTATLLISSGGTIPGRLQDTVSLLRGEKSEEDIAKGMEKGVNKGTKGLGSAIAKSIGSALVGAGIGAAITQGRGREGLGGVLGGALGGGLGSALGATSLFKGIIGGGGLAGGALSMFTSFIPLIGGFIGSMFDKPIDAEIPELDELEDPLDNLSYEIQKLEKALNTVNDTMENLINAPSNFVLPIPKGILENSVTAQSAIATPLQAGGLIIKSGQAYMHKGDRVNGVSDSGGSSSAINTSIVINGANKNPEEIANEVMNRLNRDLFRQAQRTGNTARRY